MMQAMQYVKQSTRKQATQTDMKTKLCQLIQITKYGPDFFMIPQLSYKQFVSRFLGQCQSVRDTKYRSLRLIKELYMKWNNIVSAP